MILYQLLTRDGSPYAFLVQYGQCSIQKYSLFHEFISVKSLEITPEIINHRNSCMRVLRKNAYLSITCGTKSKRQSTCLSLEKKKRKQKSDGYCVIVRHQELEAEPVKGGS